MPVTPARSSTAWEWLQEQLAGRPFPGVLTLIGLGDIELLGALEAHAPRSKLLVLEPDPAQAKRALAHPSVDAWRRSGRLAYLAGPEYAGADQAWRVFPTRFEQPPLIVHPSSAAAPGLRGAVAVLAKIVFGAKSNAEARRRFAPRYLLNSIRNLPAILAGGDLRALTGYAKGAPAIVVGAGPSLDASIPELARVAQGAVIVATDTALRPLLAHGIAPQFVVALDPSELNGRHLLDLPPCQDTWLIAESALDPRAAAAFAGRTLWFRVAPHQPWPWLNQLGVDVGRIDVWGSVLTAGFQVAALAGCDPIVMVGADLSFPDGRPYVRGTSYEFDWAWAAALGTPVEETWRAQLARRKDTRIERDVTGADTTTTGVMLEFRDWLVAQARKTGRRVVNATGRGLLFGDGVDQARLSDVMTPGRLCASVFDRDATPNGRHAAEVTNRIARLNEALVAGVPDEYPLPDWREFSGDGFDADKLREALATVGDDLTRPLSPALESGDQPAADLTTLPEALTRVRAALRGEPDLPAGVAAPSRDRPRLLAAAFELLRDIVETATCGADFAGFPNSNQIEDAPAGASAMWPEGFRRTVLRFEALLGRAWARSGPRPARHGLPSLSPYDVRRGGSRTRDPRPYARHACLLLAIEWLRCVARDSESTTDDLDGVVDRLWTLEGVQRTAAEWCRPRAAIDLVIDAPWTGAPGPVLLPMSVSAEAGWALRAGVLHDGLGEPEEAGWVVGGAGGPRSVRISVRPSGSTDASAPAASAVSVMPRRLESPEWPRLKLAGQAVGGALCVVPGTKTTVLVAADGRLTPYQTWPRPVTGAASLGDRGEVAWNSGSGTTTEESRPFLMHRPAPDANVLVILLPFRPSRGIWWQGRLYMNCLPTDASAGGFGSWAPGEVAVHRCSQLPLQGIVPSDEGLWLEPYMPGTGASLGRHRAEGVGAWTWTAGRPVRRTLGVQGAASASATNGDWTAVAYPQADVITLTAGDGRTRHLHCYFPVCLAWSGDSLVVWAGNRDLLIFDRLAITLGATTS